MCPAGCQRGELDVARRERPVVAAQPDIMPCLVKRVNNERLLVEDNDSGATLVTPSSEVLNRRKRRGSNPHLQNLVGAPLRVPVLDFRLGASNTPRWPLRGETPSPRRYRTRARKLTPEQESAIRALAETKSLRSLAADFGVSHETIRTVVRQVDVKVE